MPRLLLASALALLCASSPLRAADPACDGKTGLDAVKQSFLTGSALPDPGSGPCRDQVLALRQRVQAVQAGTDGSDAQKQKLQEEIRAVAGLVGQSPPQDVVDAYLSRTTRSARPSQPPAPTAQNRTPPPPSDEATRAADADARGDAALAKAKAAIRSWDAPELAAFGVSGTDARTALPDLSALPPRAQLPASLQTHSAAPPDPVQGQAPAAPSLLDRAATWTYETGKGYATGAANLYLDANNLVNRTVNAGLSLTPIQYRFRDDLHIAPQSDTERYAQNAVAVASLVYGAAGLVRSAPEIAAATDGLVARGSSLADRMLGRTPKVEPIDPVPPVKAPVAVKPAALPRTLSDPKSLEGATADEIRSLIPKDWVQRPMKKGTGTIFEFPGTRGSDIIEISEGTPGVSDALHQGPYIKIVRRGQTVRIPLQGNSTLP
jgi:hypothetical protein